MSEALNRILIQGSKGGKSGGKSRQAVEAPNTLQSKALMRVLEIVSEGEIVGLVNGAKSIFFDNTPLQNSDGSYNFAGVAFDHRAGTPDQDYIKGFPDIEEEVAVGIKVIHANPIVQTITDHDVDGVRVTIRIPTLSEQNLTNGDLNGSSVQFKFEYQPSGGSYIEAFTDTITGKCTAPYERQYRIDLTGNAPWNIKMTRISPDSDKVNIQNEIYFSSYTNILDSKLIYPDTALVSFEIDSSLFGESVPTRSYLIKGKIISVPQNYNPVTRVYTGIWDGTFKQAWSDNPAWVLFDLLINDRYGLGQFIDEDEIDKYGFYTIAQYCDELVDDGAGGTEPRYTFNGVIQSQDDALKVLQSVASNFRGMLYWGSDVDSGILTAVADMPKDPIKIFSPANVIGGLFSYSGTALSARHSTAYISWNDPGTLYTAAIEVYEDPTLITQYGYRKLDLVAYGCTSRGQAHRLGKWALDTEANESETCSFTVGLADADCRPGDIVKVIDPDYAGVRYGGRLSAINSNSQLVLDDTITIEADQTYSIDVQLPDGTLASANIINTAGDYSTIDLDVALPELPQANAMWAITASNLAPRLFRVLAVKETTPLQYEITALVYDPNKYARVEENINTTPLTFTRFTTGALLPPSNIQFYEYFYASGSSRRSAVSISWEASKDPRTIQYQVEARRPGNNNYELIAVGASLSAVIENTIDGSWAFRVRALDMSNNISPYVTVGDATLSINNTPPDDVANFNITVSANNSILQWSPVTSRNLSHYEIRYSADDMTPSWENSLVIVEQEAHNATSAPTPSRTGSYLIKAVTFPTDSNPNGVYSQNATIITTNVDALSNYNFIQSLIESPDFLGVFDSTRVNGDSLELDLDGDGNVLPSGMYSFEVPFDLGAVYTSRLTPLITAGGNLLTNDVDDWADVDLINNVDGATDGQWSVRMQVSTTLDEPEETIETEGGHELIHLEDGDTIYLEQYVSGGATWTEWADITAGDYLARAFRFRVLMTSNFATVSPSISSLGVQIDMPDQVQSENDLAVTVSGMNVVFGYQFRSENPAIAISAQNMQTGDYYTITAKSSSGFTIQFFNSSGIAVARTFDYVAKGYGVLTS